MIMTHEPNMMHHLRPNVSLTSGISGRPMTEPSGRAEARMPLYAPVGCPKSEAMKVRVKGVIRVEKPTYSLSRPEGVGQS